MQNTKLELRGIEKTYPGATKKSVTDFSLQIEQGEFIALVGPSGCGKSTTLRMIAGLEDITGGELIIDDQVMNEVEPKDRKLAMVFQNYALYPHMTIYDNMAYGLKVKKIAKSEIEQKVKWAADVLQLTDHLQKKPSGLSGGQRQRVALGRCMVRDVNLFLMDEPLSNLDAKLRVTMRNEIKSLHDKLGTTTIYVTHDQVEAMTMADRIVLMKDGEVQQVGKPLELYSNPANLFVAQFIGSPQMNILEIEKKGNVIYYNQGTQKIDLKDFAIYPANIKDGKYLMGIRPEHVSVENMVLKNNPEWVIDVTIDYIEKLGNENYVFSSIGDTEMRYRISASRMEELEKGDKFQLGLKLNYALFFDIDSKERVY